MIIVFKQFKNNEKFKFIFLLDFISIMIDQSIILRHADINNENNCYINLVHLEIYSDSNHNMLLLIN